MMIRIVMACAALWIGALDVEAADAPSLQGLKSGESLVVEYFTSGCFHSDKSLFVFTENEVTIFSLPSKSSDGGDTPDDRKRLGVVKLSGEDVLRLDELFEFYASEPSGFCTTVDQITVSVRKGGRFINKYLYTDGSCNAVADESVLTLGVLKARLKKVDPAP